MHHKYQVVVTRQYRRAVLYEKLWLRIGRIHPDLVRERRE